MDGAVNRLALRFFGESAGGVILRAADYAEFPNKYAQPAELIDARISLQWGLPYAGGWKDQPAPHFEKMRLALATYNAVISWRKAKNWGEWRKKNPDQWKLIKKLLQLRDEVKHGNRKYNRKNINHGS